MNYYDHEYDSSVVNSITHYYGSHKDVCEEVRKGIGRSLEKSALAKNPDYQKFLQVVKDSITPRSEWENDYEAIYQSWETGGMSGGTCWGDQARPYSEDPGPMELTELDKVLEKLCPSMSFLQYKNMTNEILKTASYTEREYYGNETDYTIKYVLYSKLFSYLKEKGLI